MSRHYRHLKSIITHIIFTSIIVLALAVPLVAQQGSTSQQPRVSERERRRMEMEDHVFALEMLERQARKPERQLPSLDPTYLQVRKDFEQLQVLSYQIIQVMKAADKALDYKYIAEGASEIKKRATRLKNNLILPESEKDEASFKMPVEMTDEHLKSSMERLDKLVQSFVNNAMFQHPQVLDLELAAQAKRDLEGIVRVSEHLKKGADKLNKKSP